MIRTAPPVRRRQHGIVLLMGLIMLVVMTLIAVTAINLSTTGIQVVGNSQFRQEAVAAGQMAIETVVSSSAFMTAAPAVQSIDTNMDGNPDFTVTFAPAPSCQYYVPIDPTQSGIPKECFGSLANVCFWTIWDITAVVTDVSTGTTGASISITQGVRTIAGLNAALASCGT